MAPYRFAGQREGVGAEHVLETAQGVDLSLRLVEAVVADQYVARGDGRHAMADRSAAAGESGEHVRGVDLHRLIFGVGKLGRDAPAGHVSSGRKPGDADAVRIGPLVGDAGDTRRQLRVSQWHAGGGQDGNQIRSFGGRIDGVGIEIRRARVDAHVVRTEIGIDGLGRVMQ